MSALVGELTTQLKSALDIAVIALTRQADPAAEVANVSFPIAKSLSAWNSKEMRKKVDALPSAVGALVSSLNPYCGGNDDLWHLKVIRDQDVHIGLVRVAAVGGVRNLIRVDPRGTEFVAPKYMEVIGALALTIVDAVASAESSESLIIDIQTLGANPETCARVANQKVHLDINVCFAGGQPCAGMPVIPTLRRLSDYVEQVLNSLDRLR